MNNKNIQGRKNSRMEYPKNNKSKIMKMVNRKNNKNKERYLRIL